MNKGWVRKFREILEQKDRGNVSLLEERSIEDQRKENIEIGAYLVEKNLTRANGKK